MKTVLAWVVVAIVFVALIGGCTAAVGASKSDKSALRLAHNLGISNAHVTGRDVWFVELMGCGRDDIVLFHIAGINARGQHITLDVCQGILKGATARG